MDEKEKRSVFCSDYFIIIIIMQPLFIISACTYSCTAAWALSKDVPRANAASAVLPSSRRRNLLSIWGSKTKENIHLERLPEPQNLILLIYIILFHFLLYIRP